MGEEQRKQTRTEIKDRSLSNKKAIFKTKSSLGDDRTRKVQNNNNNNHNHNNHINNNNKNKNNNKNNNSNSNNNQRETTEQNNPPQKRAKNKTIQKKGEVRWGSPSHHFTSTWTFQNKNKKKKNKA